MANTKFERPEMTAELGRKLLWWGAALGAVLASVLAWALGLDSAAGSIGMHALAGAALGGLVGFMVGALMANRREEGLYNGPERRRNNSQYPGVNRRAHT
jgi:ABC-type Fe3+-siderophore transport system permease subunit